MTIELHNGDCLEIMPAIADESVDLILTDPPYGIDYQSARRTDKSQWKPKIANDLKPYTKWIKRAIGILKESGRMICFCRWDVQEVFKIEMEKCGLTVKSQIIWDKISHGMGDLKGEYAPRHENILYATKGRYEFTHKRPTTVLQYMKVAAEKLVHPNEKPVELIKKIVSDLTEEGDIISDPFMGSGSTGVAAETLGRNFIGIELDPDYFKIAEKRIQEAKDQFGLFKEIEQD